MRLRLRVILLIVELLIFNYSLKIETEATVRYVSKTGSSTPPYTSWATAADSIQKCINICEDGDTVYVGNGVYYETLVVNKILTLIGSSMDSTIIDGSNSTNQSVIYVNRSSLSINNIFIRILSSIVDYRNGLAYFKSYGTISFCRIEIKGPYGGYGIVLANSSCKVENCIFRTRKSIGDECPADTCNGLYRNNIIISANDAVNFTFGGSPKFINNIVIAENNVEVWNGIGSYAGNITVLNNLVANFYTRGIGLATLSTSGKIIAMNNLVTHIPQSGIDRAAISIYTTDSVFLSNNIIKDSKTGIVIRNTPLRANYNLFWNNQQNVFGLPLIGDSNLVNIDPMLVNDIKPSVTNNWDYHLQAYSPAIDKGDPSILDPDGSRSDIGMYGGPYGEVYTYQDLAPRPPRNLSAVVDSGRVRLKWNKNTEADTSHYRIYRSLTPNFTIDTTKLIGTTTDTNYVDILSQSYQKLYYKLTCVDKQGNQSGPSEELTVNLVSINEYPTVVSDYYLYQNYPNPFSVREGNSTTKIGYKLKERGYVKLMVYDIKGERVAVLVNEEKEAGYYEVEFDANVYQLDSRQTGINIPMASGIYLYRIEVIGEGNIPVYTEMRKMVLVK